MSLIISPQLIFYNKKITWMAEQVKKNQPHSTLTNFVASTAKDGCAEWISSWFKCPSRLSREEEGFRTSRDGWTTPTVAMLTQLVRRTTRNVEDEAQRWIRTERLLDECKSPLFNCECKDCAYAVTCTTKGFQESIFTMVLHKLQQYNRARVICSVVCEQKHFTGQQKAREAKAQPSN